VREAITYTSGSSFSFAFEFTKPKTQRSNRTITISATVIEALRQHKRTQLEGRMHKGSTYQDKGLVFATALGSPLLWRSLGKRHLKPLLSAAGIPQEGLSMYSLRHTAASLRIANGENIRVTAEVLGTSVAMIDKTYSHVPRKQQQSATDSIARVLYGT
jgi:integrase